MPYKTCVTIAERNPKKTKQVLSMALKKSDYAEIRLDFLKPNDVPVVLELIKKNLKKCICTLRPKKEGGKFSSNEKERVSIIKLISEYSPFLLDVEFHTLKKDKNLQKYLKKSNFFIHCPIKPDPLPTVVFEGIESGTPVIFTNLGGSYEILDSGKNGLSIDHHSVKKSVENILEFFENTFEQEKNVMNAKSFVEKNFSKNLFNDSLKTLISKIV